MNSARKAPGMTNPLDAIPDGDAVTWLIGWRDRDTNELGNDLVKACHADEAVRGFEIDNPRRKVQSVHRSPIAI